MRYPALHPAIPTPGHVAHVIGTRLRAPALDRATIDEVLERYAVRSSRPALNLAGRRNENLLVRTNDGDVVLRRYRQGWHRRSIEHEHSILVELERCGFPAVRLRRTLDGATVVEHGGRLHAVFGFEAGANVTGLRFTTRRAGELFELAGATLAHFHDALAEFEPRWEHHAGGRPVAQPAPDDAVGSAVERIARLEAELAGTELPETVLHTDFGLHNLLFRPGREPVVLDLELARRGRRISDVLSTVDRLVPRGGSHLVAGYRRVVALTDAELELAPVVWELDCLRAGLRSWHNHQVHGGERRLRTARSRLARATRPPLLVGGAP